MNLIAKKIFEKAKKNIKASKNYYPNENCSDLAKSVIHIITTEYGIRTWTELFEQLKFIVDPSKNNIENLELFLKECSKPSIIDNE